MQMERADQMEIFRTKRTTSSEVLHFFRSNRLEGKLPFRLYKISISTAQAVKRQLEMMLMIYRVSSAFSSNIKFRKFTETLAELLGNLRSTTKETTTTSIDRARTGTRTSFSVCEMKVKKRSACTTTTT